MIAAGELLEYATVFGKYCYGTPRLPVEEALAAGRVVLLEIDVQGATQVRDQHPDALLLFIDAPSRDEQRRRLEGRGDPPDKVDKRLAIADAEAAAARDLGMLTIINDDLGRTTTEVVSAIEAARIAGS